MGMNKNIDWERRDVKLVLKETCGRMQWIDMAQGRGQLTWLACQLLHSSAIFKYLYV